MRRLMVLSMVAGLVAALLPSSPASAGSSCFGRKPTITGTDGNDTIRGTRGNDVIAGGAGHDSIAGRGGRDRICGQSGNDVVSGGRGSDRISGAWGIDTLHGNRGHDLIRFGCGECVDVDETETQEGSGGRGHDRLIGGDEQEVMHGGPGRDHLDGGRSIQAGAFGLPDRSYGGPGDDTVVASGAGGFASGGEGDDELRAGGRNTTLQGNEGDDHLIGAEPCCTTADFSASAQGVMVDLAGGTANGEGSDLLVNVTSVTGSAHDDAIAGTDGGDALSGLGGDDRLDARGGDDVLMGDFDTDPGDDTLIGGDGVDRVTYNYAPAAVQVDLATGTATGEGDDSLSGIENLDGSRFADVLLGDDGPNLISGLGYPKDGDRREMIDGRGGDDVLELESSTPGDVEGGAGDDVILGYSEDDFLSGGPGDDTITGSLGDDRLDGGDGNDVLDGGDDLDTCTNGETVSNCEP